jgi:hypothetical protein
MSHNFEPEESQAIFKAIRQLGFTVNQIGTYFIHLSQKLTKLTIILAYAALANAWAKDNPPDASTPADSVLFTFGLVNSRYTLKEPYSIRDGYPGSCIGMSPIIVPVSGFVGLKGDEFLSKELLLSTAEIVKREYKRQKDYESLLAASAHVGIMVGGWLIKSLEAKKPA